MGSRDTIQAYIDLWENASTSTTTRERNPSVASKSSIPPTPPPKDSARKLWDWGNISAGIGDERMLVMEVITPPSNLNTLEDRPPQATNMTRLRKPRPTPLQATWEVRRNSALRRRASDSTLEVSRFSPETVVARESVIKPDSPSAMSFTSIVNGNPFRSISPVSPSSSVVRTNSPLSMISMLSSIRGTPFEPDDMWRHHKPPPGARVTAMGHQAVDLSDVKAMRRRSTVGTFGMGRSPDRPGSMSVPSSAKEGHLALAKGDSLVPATSPRTPRTSVPRRRSSMGTYSLASTVFEQDEDDFYHALTPRPPVPPVPHAFRSAPSSPDRDRIAHRSSIRFSRISTESSSSSTNSDDSQTISNKAAAMLGIDTIPLSMTHSALRSPIEDTAVVMDYPEMFDVSALYASHRRTGSQSSASGSARSRNAWSTISYASTAPSSFTHMPYDATLDAACVWKALKKSKKPDTDLLTATLVAVSHEPYKMVQLRQKYKELYADDLVKHIKSCTQGYYRLALARLVEGPYEAEAQWLDKGHDSLFMDDKLIAEALFGRNPDEIKLIKLHYEQIHGYPLKRALKQIYLGHSGGGSAFDSLGSGPSGWFGRACIRTLAADREVERVESLISMSPEQLAEREAQLNAHVDKLYTRPRGSSMKFLNKELLLQIVVKKSDLYLKELSCRFHERHGVDITELILPKDRSKQMGNLYYPVNLGYAMTYALNGATNKPNRDAKALEDCMKGLTTNMDRLIARVIRIHYDADPRHMQYVRDVYFQRYGKPLDARIAKQTKGIHRELMLKLLDGHNETSINDMEFI